MCKFIGLFFVLLISCMCEAQTSPAGVNPSLQFNWVPPTLRENGSALAAAEIGGYELRYRVKGASVFNSVVVTGGAVKSYTLSGLAAGDYEFQIGVFDVDGVYSSFVQINYKFNLSAPKPATGFTLKRSGVDVIEICLSSPNCKVVGDN